VCQSGGRTPNVSVGQARIKFAKASENYPKGEQGARYEMHTRLVRAFITFAAQRSGTELGSCAFHRRLRLGGDPLVPHVQIPTGPQFWWSSEISLCEPIPFPIPLSAPQVCHSSGTSSRKSARGKDLGFRRHVKSFSSNSRRVCGSGTAQNHISIHSIKTLSTSLN